VDSQHGVDNRPHRRLTRLRLLPRFFAVDVADDFFALREVVVLPAFFAVLFAVFFAVFVPVRVDVFFLPPPSCLFTVAQAARSAVFRERPRFS
jgi:hypothetical protein